MSRDITEFTRLLKPHYSDALNYTRALCSSWSPDDAEDVLQQSFLLALENFGSLSDAGKFRSWFFKIITTTFYQSVRKHFWKKFLPLDARDLMPQIPDVFDRAEQSENRIALNRALAGLSAKERTAILLFEVASFSIEEIRAIQSEKSVSAVKSRLSRARKKLKKFMTEKTEQSPRRTDSGGEVGNFEGDFEDETFKLISEIRIER